MRIARRDILVPLALGAFLAVPPAAAQAQGYFPASSPHPVLLVDAYLDVPALLLTPPRGYDLAGSEPSERDARMEAYREFERALRDRTGRLGSGSRDERSGARSQLLSDLGQRLESLPGAQLISHGRALWERVERTTDFDLEGYRVRLLVDEAVEGKLALKVQKRLR